MASYGTRGDVEPSVAVGRELQRRGHDVRLAVPPDLVGFAEDAGLTAVPYGTEIAPKLEAYRNLWTTGTRGLFSAERGNRIREEASAVYTQQWDTEQWEQLTATLVSLADGADVISTSVGYDAAVANVAEYQGIPFVALHTFPWRPNGRLFRLSPPPLTRTGMVVYDWMAWQLSRKAEEQQRLELGLPPARRPLSLRVADRRVLEIQAYDAVCFPGLREEWSGRLPRRPFVGALTMELVTGAEDEVRSWIETGSPPIGFALGSIPVESPEETVRMIRTACAELGERALICAGGTDMSDVPASPDVKVVGAVNYGAVFPHCRAVVHQGGSGTMAAGLRAGVPALALWTAGDQPFWGAQLKRLKVGTKRRLSATTADTLIADLRRILAPDHAEHARRIAAHMTEPAVSVAQAADLMETHARIGTA